jgi:hypothetical protein
MKWILLIIGIGILRGILFPDYRFQPNIVIIPFGLPLLLAALSAYLGATRRLSWLSASIWGLFSVYLSTLVGIFVYGMVFMATIGIQTVTFVLGLGVSSVLAKRYNKAIKPDAP